MFHGRRCRALHGQITNYIFDLLVVSLPCFIVLNQDCVQAITPGTCPTSQSTQPSEQSKWQHTTIDRALSIQVSSSLFKDQLRQFAEILPRVCPECGCRKLIGYLSEVRSLDSLFTELIMLVESINNGNRYIICKVLGFVFGRIWGG